MVIIKKLQLLALTVQVLKPEGLSTFGRSENMNYIYQSIKFLTPDIGDQFIPAKSSLSHWFSSWKSICRELIYSHFQDILLCQ